LEKQVKELINKNKLIDSTDTGLGASQVRLVW